MTIAHDASTRWPTTENTADATSGDRTATHTPVGTPAGVAVVICNSVLTSAPVSGVLYGGVAMSLTETATDTDENGRVDIYTLVGGSIPTGAQTVTFQGATATAKFATINTVTSGTGAAAVHTSGHVNTTTAADPQVSLVLTATSQVYGGLHTGNTSPSASPLSGCTLQNNRDYGALAAQTLRRTSADTAGTVTLGVTLISEDYCIAAVAFTEPAAGSADLTAATLTLTAVALTPTPGPVTVDLTPAILTLTAPAITPTPGPITVDLTPATMALVAPSQTLIEGVLVSLTPATMALAGVAVDPQPQPVTVNLTPVALALTAVAVSPHVPATVSLTPAVLALAAVAVHAHPPLPFAPTLTPAAGRSTLTPSVTTSTLTLPT